MKLTMQDKQDFIVLVQGFCLFIMAAYAVSFVLSQSLLITMDHARHLVAAVITAFALAYPVREILPIYWRIYLSVAGVVLLVGTYGAASEIYVRHFTILGMGDLPTLFVYAYTLITGSVAASTIYFVKHDFMAGG